MTLPACDGKPCPRMVAAETVYNAQAKIAEVRRTAAILAEVAVGVGYVVAAKVLELAENARRRVGA